MIDVAARLSAPDLDEQIQRLGFRPDDAADLRRVIASVLANPDQLDRIAVLAQRLLPIIGDFEGQPKPWDHEAARDESLGLGVLPLLTLLITVTEVREFHQSRGIPDDISWGSLADLGQQVWVHRQVSGRFGLQAQGWLCVAWSGALYWLGRLQFNLQRLDSGKPRLPGVPPRCTACMPCNAGESHAQSCRCGDWVLSTHIPQSGPLTPQSVDASFAAAEEFFGRHFADIPYEGFYCCSWLLDPQLVDDLAPESNMVRFQQRWELFGEPLNGDSDTIFFTFRKPADVDLETLPRDTSLQRAIIDRLQAGGHWYLRRGRTKGTQG